VLGTGKVANMYTKGEFTNYVEKVKKNVESGKIDKYEATYLILGKVAQVLSDLPKVPNMKTYEEQFMDDRKLEAQNVL